MDYLRAALKLTGRCKESRRLENNTYLKRRSDSSIAVRLHNTDVVTFHADGRVELYTGGWNTVTTKDRMHTYSPARVWTESGVPFASYGGQEVALVNERRATIMPDGTLVGDSAEEARVAIKARKNEAARPRARARYWIRKAASGASYKGTWQSIMDEPNVSVRVSKMKCYGIERFFLDCGAGVIDEQAGYQLLDIKLTSWQNMRALKMACTTTGAVYINPVPPHVCSVPEGLDWMFNTENYLGTVVQQA